jgi:hypothetical protein
MVVVGKVGGRAKGGGQGRGQILAIILVCCIAEYGPVADPARLFKHRQRLSRYNACLYAA